MISIGGQYLTDNYNVILLPTFETSQMLRGRQLSKMTKRLMCMFSFYSFKQKLKYKANQKGVKVIIVDESYTSCTCTRCGTRKRVGGQEEYHCDNCDSVIDRDEQGARNILIKNLGTLSLE